MYHAIFGTKRLQVMLGDNLTSLPRVLVELGLFISMAKANSSTINSKIL